MKSVLLSKSLFLHRPTVAFPLMLFDVPGVLSAISDASTCHHAFQRPPNEVSYAQRRHMVESLRTVARYVRWLCIGQLGVHQVFKERFGLPLRGGVLLRWNKSYRMVMHQVNTIW